MKKRFLAAVMCLCLVTGYAQDSSRTAVTLTLRICIETALKNNIDVRRSDYTAETNKADWQYAKGQLLPSVNGSVYHGSNQGRNINPYTNTYINQSVNFANYSLDGSLNLFSGFSVDNTIKQNKLAFEAGKMDAQQQRDYVTINVILAYLSVLSNQDQQTLAEQQADVSRKQVERLSILNKEGAVTPSKYYDVKGQLATDELNIISTKNALETAKVNLAQLMNVAYSENVVLERIGSDKTPDTYEVSVEDIYSSASKNLAIVKAAGYHHSSAVKATKAAKGLLYPRLSLNGGLGTNYSSTGTLQQYVSSSDVAGDNYILLNSQKIPVYAPDPVYTSSKITYGDQWKNNFNSYVNVAVTIPLLNGLQTRYRIKQAKILEDRTSYEEKTTKIQLKQSIGQAYVNNKSAFQRYQTLNRQVEDLAESFREAQIQFESGVLTSVEFLVVKSRLDQAQLSLVSAQYDYILRSKILDYYQSKPLW